MGQEPGGWVANQRRHELGVGVLLLGALVLLAWMAIKVGAIGSLEQQVVVRARIRDAAGIKPGAAVSVAGVDVGKVMSMGLDHDVATAKLTLDAAAGLRQDARLRIRARSVLGEKYLELLPRSRDTPLLQDGDLLEVDGEQTEIDEMVNAMGPLLGAIDPETLAAALSAVGTALDEDPERLARMLENADAILRDGAETTEALPGLVARLDGTLDRVDAMVDSLQARASEARAPLQHADELVLELRQTRVEVDGLVGDGRAAVADAREAMGSARELMDGFGGIDDDVRRVLSNLVEIDKWELRRLLREEGILIRVKAREVVPE